MKKILSIVLLLAVAIFAAGNQKVSKKEMFSRARDALKEAMVNNDIDRAGQALEYLRANVNEGAPLNRFEEYLICSEIGKTDEAVKIYAELRRTILDTGYVRKKDIRVTVQDGLNNYLYRNLSPFKKETADSLNTHIQESDASQESKDLYATLIYSELVLGIRTLTIRGKNYGVTVIADTTCAEEFLERANNFVKNHPMSENAMYIKEQTIPFVQKFMDVHRQFRKDPLAHKYYTGGLSVYGGTWLDFMNGTATDVISHKNNSNMVFEAEIQYKRLMLGLTMMLGGRTDFKDTSRANYYDDNYDDENLAFTLGFVAYEMRYAKVTPFVGLGNTYFMDIDNSIEARFLMGVNVDSHLLVKKPNYIGGFSFGLNARFKWMTQFGSLEMYDWLEDRNKKFSAINTSFAFELGFFIW